MSLRVRSEVAVIDRKDSFLSEPRAALLGKGDGSIVEREEIDGSEVIRLSEA